MSMHKPGGHSPWGVIDDVKKIAEGIERISTPSHGGLHLSSIINAAMPEALRRPDGWYEEDVEWALVALAFPAHFAEHERTEAEKVVRNWLPDVYEAFTGATLAPGQSFKKDEATGIEAHRHDQVVISAFGDWHASVPEGWVGVTTLTGEAYQARMEGRSYGAETYQHFLVPADEYSQRDKRIGLFVCDQDRHPAWHPSLPKADQVLPEADQSGMRP